jgi:hypothetical protein
MLLIGRLLNSDVMSYCLMVRLFPVDIEQAVLDNQRYIRDMARAIETFLLVSDVEGGEWATNLIQTYINPFILKENMEYSSMISFDLRADTTENVAMSRIKPGLSSASALLRGAGYKVSIKVKPTKQLELPGTETEVAVDAS